MFKQRAGQRRVVLKLDSTELFAGNRGSMKSLKSALLLSAFLFSTAHAGIVGVIDNDGVLGPSCEDALVASTIADIIAEKTGLRPVAPAGVAVPEPEPIVAPEVAAPQKTNEERIAEIKDLLDSQNEITKLVVHQEPQTVSASKIKSTLGKVGEFFGTLNKIFFERESLVDVIRKAFVSEGSVLILGPGGTAKSDVADTVGENIVNEKQETSYFTLQLTQDTTAAETQGGMIVEDALAGRTIRNWEEGVLGSYVVFLDEFFDGRLKFLRSFLKAFNERKYTQGRHTHPGLTKVFIAASNKYLNQIYEMFGNNDPQALIDRFYFVYYAPGVLQDTASILGLAEKTRPSMPKLTFKQLDEVYNFSKTVPMSRLQVLRTQYIFSQMRRKLQAQEVSALNDYLKARQRGERVQPPYKSTRVFSPRSLAVSFKLIKVQALLRYAEQPSADLAVEPGDVDNLLSSFLIMQGPPDEKMDATLDSAEMDPYQKSQLNTVQIEREALKETMDDLHKAVDRAVNLAKSAVKDLTEVTDEETKTRALFAYHRVLTEMLTALEEVDQAEKIGAEQIAALEALQILQAPSVQQWLK